MRYSTCTAQGCLRAATAQGLCAAHYGRKRNGADLAPPLRRRQRMRLCLRTGCETKFWPKHAGDWYCTSEHRRAAQAGADTDAWSLSAEENRRIGADLAEKEKHINRGIRFGRGLKVRLKARSAKPIAGGVKDEQV